VPRAKANCLSSSVGPPLCFDGGPMSADMAKGWSFPPNGADLDFKYMLKP